MRFSTSNVLQKQNSCAEKNCHSFGVYGFFIHMSLYMSKLQVNDVDKLFCMVSGEHDVDGLIKKIQMKDNLTNRHPWMTDGQSSHLPRSHIEESLDLELRLSI